MHPRGISIEDQSLLHFSPISFTDLKSEWVFFYSKTGVRYFLDQGGSHNNKKIGTFGPGTAHFFFERTNREVDFIGSGERNDVAIKFRKVLNNDMCLFVVGKNSLRSIQKSIKIDQFLEVIVYDNKPKTNIDINNPNVAVFTSPMAVQTYFKNYPHRNHLNIAIGKTTFKSLCDCGIKNNQIADNPTESSMAVALQSYLNKL